MLRKLKHKFEDLPFSAPNQDETHPFSDGERVE